MHAILRQIINRDCHVSLSNRAVIKHVISRLKRKYRTFAAMSPADRRTLMSQCVAIHTANRKEYFHVMGGGRW